MMTLKIFNRARLTLRRLAAPTTFTALRPVGPAITLAITLAAMFVVGAAGCNHSKQQTPSNTFQDGPGQNIDPQDVQASVMSFADRYLAAMADVYDRAQQSAKTPEAQLTAQRAKIVAGVGALGNAVNPNPVVGLMDMCVMVTLTREISQEPWVAEMFGPAIATAIVDALKLQETNIWAIAANYLTAGQIAELHRLAGRWRKEHPEQRYIASARLADFPEAKPGAAGGLQLTTSVFGLVRLDPFTGLDPAVRQVEETRILAERMFYYLQHMTIMISWQVDALYYQMLSAPQVKQILTDTATIAGSTTKFTDSTKEFADVSGRFGQTIEKFRLQLPDQQATLVKQLDALIALQRDNALKQVDTIVAQQRDAALKQATTQIAAQRAAAVDQLNATVIAQQDLMTKNLQTVSDASIDRLYQRARALVLIAVVSVLVAVLLYRLATRPRRA
jgi:hypothetical protein